MAGTVKPPTFKPFGDQGPTVFLSTDANPPSHTGDGNFAVGDLVINSAPVAGGFWGWMVTTAGTGATAVFKGISTDAF